MPPPTHEPVAPKRDGPHSRAQVAQPWPTGDHDDEHPLHPPPHLVGGVGLQDRLPVDRGDQIGRTPHGKQRDHQPERPREPGRRNRQPPDDDRPDQSQPLSADPADPTGQQPSDDGADRDRGVEPAGCPRAAEALLRDLWEQRPRQRHHHRDDVHGERHQQHGPAGDEREPFDHREETRSRHHSQRPQRREPVRRVQPCGEERHVDAVRRRVAALREDQTGHQRAEHGTQVDRRGAQRVGRRHQVDGQDPRDHRATGG